MRRDRRPDRRARRLAEHFLFDRTPNRKARATHSEPLIYRILTRTGIPFAEMLWDTIVSRETSRAFGFLPAA
ncbi:MAG: hypothetical protein CR217_03010 [Beijerinckiaceae bacterium]|nr:MAG: hypothetical protein CR217_03010 [Beijerinckiaceae bacterium]